MVDGLLIILYGLGFLLFFLGGLGLLLNVGFLNFVVVLWKLRIFKCYFFLFFLSCVLCFIICLNLVIDLIFLFMMIKL